MTVNLIDRIIDEKPAIEIGGSEIVFKSDEQAKMFRRCLRIVRVEAKIERTGNTVVFCIRPKNPNSLKDALVNRGLADTVATKVCDYLNFNADEWIRCVSQSRV